MAGVFKERGGALDICRRTYINPPMDVSLSFELLFYGRAEHTKAFLHLSASFLTGRQSI